MGGVDIETSDSNHIVGSSDDQVPSSKSHLIRINSGKVEKGLQ